MIIKKPKWTSISQYVDLDTGEVLQKNIATEQYNIINKKILKKFHHETNNGICYITNECKRKQQGKLF